MYLGRAPVSISHLETLVTGIHMGRGADVPGRMDAFEEWVLWRHPVPGFSANSFGLILKQAGGNEGHAFQLFFDYLEDYLAERQQIGADGIRAGLRASQGRAKNA